MPPARKKPPSPSTAAHSADASPVRELLVGERRRSIRQLIEKQERVTVDELAARFRTSEVTIRSDLTALAKTGGVVRTHGGALLQRDGDDLPISVKKNLHHAEKVRIAAAAVQLIEDGDTVLLDSGTTTAEIARQIATLKMQRLHIVTNALNIAVLLAHVPHVVLVMPGGVLRPQSYSLAGPQAEQALQGLHVDKLFLGVDSLDPQIGLMTPHVLEAQLNAQMIRIARRVIAVADASKLMRRNLSVIARVEQIHQLITDASADRAIVEELRRRGVEVTLV
jgi:DeoR family transcriptional regulator, aga operon transcriptional repressor